MSNFASDLYEDTSNLGKSYATIQVFIGIIIFIILCLCGLYNNFKTDTHGNVKATIGQVSCNKKVYSENTQSIYSCDLRVSYIVNDKVYINNLTLENSQQYVLNQDIDISYDLNNPNIITEKQANNSTTGSISMVIGSLIMLSCGVNYYLANNSKIYSATTGVATTADLIKKIF
jgi:hypothetical protein